ncbi:MAG: signal peptidase I [Ruminococcus sp.]|nr:signal peptidase I [Ruminococcus sp.]
MKIDDKMYDEIFTDDNTSENDVVKVKFNNNPLCDNIYDWVNSIIIAVVAVVILLTFCFRLIDVDGTSMEKTLINTDKVIVTNLFYTPQNGDVVVISHGEQYDKPLIKRIIATEGQKLEIDFETDEIRVDGSLIDEPYAYGDTIMGDTKIPQVVPEGKVFVLGDNRPVSLDSRYAEVGLIDEESIIGKAQFVIIPHTYKEDALTPVLDFTKVRYIYK